MVRRPKLRFQMADGQNVMRSLFILSRLPFLSINGSWFHVNVLPSWCSCCISLTHESEFMFVSRSRYTVVGPEESNASGTACLISWRLSVGWFPVAPWPHTSVSRVSSCWCWRSKHSGFHLFFYLLHVGVLTWFKNKKQKQKHKHALITA